MSRNKIFNIITGCGIIMLFLGQDIMTAGVFAIIISVIGKKFFGDKSKNNFKENLKSESKDTFWAILFVLIVIPLLLALFSFLGQK